MCYLDSIFVTIQALYINSGLNDEYVEKFLANSFNKSILLALKFRGKFMKDFDFIDELNECIEKSLSNYDALVRAK